MTSENIFWKQYITFLKAISIALLFFWHIDSIYFSYNFNLFDTNGIYELLNTPRGFLWSLSRVPLAFGYQIFRFFIIASAFGLYLSYLNNKTSWRVFYKKRFYRVIILYWIILSLWLYLEGISDPTLLFHYFLLIPFTKYAVPMGQFWFVVYIIQLYLIFPLLVRIFNNKWAKWGLFISSFFLHQLIVFLLHLADINIPGIAFTKYLSMFLLGMLLAEAVHNKRSIMANLLRLRYSLAFCSALLLLIYLLNTVIDFTFYVEHLAYILLFFSLIPVCQACLKISYIWKFITTLSYGSYVMFLTSNLIIVKAFIWFVTIGIIPTHFNSRDVLVFSSPEMLHVYGFLFFFCTFVISYAVQLAYHKILKKLTSPA